LTKYLAKRALEESDLYEAGSYYKNGVVYYISYDIRGVYLGHIERRLEGKPRFVNYLNTSENMFLIHMSLPYIYEANEAIIVEGPADALAMWKSGVRNVVAFGGASSFGKTKLRTLKRFCEAFWFIFDRDAAGLVFYNSVKERQKLAVTTYASFIPSGSKDAAEYIHNGGDIKDLRKQEI